MKVFHNTILLLLSPRKALVFSLVQNLSKLLSGNGSKVPYLQCKHWEKLKNQPESYDICFFILT